MISTSGPFWDAAAGELKLLKCAQQYGLPVGQTPVSAHAFLRQPESEDRKLRKDPFGGPCFEGTLRKPVAFPNQVPWPEQLKAFTPS
jgi:hypothetical protein